MISSVDARPTWPPRRPVRPDRLLTSPPQPGSPLVTGPQPTLHQTPGVVLAADGGLGAIGENVLDCRPCMGYMSVYI